MKWVNLKTQTQYLSFTYPGMARGTGFDGLDPRLLWAGVSHFVKADLFAECPIPVMFEVEDEKLKEILDESPPIVDCTAGAFGLFHNFYTGFVKPTNLGFLAARVDRLRIGSIELPETKQWKYRDSSLKSVGLNACPEQVVIGIIDHGIGFASKHFASQLPSGPWESRVERIWDQQRGYPAKPLNYKVPGGKTKAWNSTKFFGYGRELVNAAGNRQIDHWLNCGKSENETYELLKYLPAQHAVTHGTHVLGVASGNRLFGSDTHGAPVQTVTDEASKAKIIAVQLPALPFKDTSGTGLCVQILDAISYIHLHAAGRKVVINLSDGAYAGPHDGTSMLERALDTFYTNNRHRSAFVVAAGNQFHERVHWQGKVEKDKPSDPIHWNVLPDDSTDSHLEIWPDSALFESDLKELSVFVTPPGSSQLGPIKLGQVFALFEDGNQPNEAAICLVAFVRNPPNSFNPASPGATRAMIHIAVAASRPRVQTGRKAAPHGIWAIELVNGGRKSIEFNAYIERDNPALGDSGPLRQSHFVHSKYRRNNGAQEILRDVGNASPIKRMGALNNVATAAQVLVVGGACLNTDASGKRHAVLAPYSASGPGRGYGARQGGDLLAPSDMSYTIRGIRGIGTRTGTSFRMDGTSVAAPQVTREIANLMAAGHLANSAKSSLSARATSGIPGPVERVGNGLI